MPHSKTIDSQPPVPKMCGIEIKIRHAAISDASTIAQFNSNMALETEERQLDAKRVLAGVYGVLGNPARGTYYVAETEINSAPTIIGQLLITYEWSDWRDGNFWWIQSVYVAKEYRGRGVFRALYQHVHDLAKRQRDVCGLRLYVDAHNEGARRTYGRLGMKCTDYRVFEIDFVLKS